MDFLNDLLQYGYLSNALTACVLSGIACGIVGTYVVCRRMVFLAGGITHASFGGLGIAFWLGANPLGGGPPFPPPPPPVPRGRQTTAATTTLWYSPRASGPPPAAWTERSS